MTSAEPRPVPMVDLAARHARLAPRVEVAVLGVLRSGRYVGGPVVERVERRVARLFGVEAAVGVNSGTDALLLGLLLLGIGPGCRVAVPALTFFATAGAVLRVGAEPVVVDVLPDRPLLDPAAIPGGVDLAIPVHLFGARAPSPGVAALDDAAQAAGWGHGPPIGAFAAVSAYPTKTLGACGDAGFLLCRHAEDAARARRLASHDQGPPHVHRSAGMNSRLDAIQAAILEVHLDDLPRRIARRRAIACRYEAELAALRPLPRDPRDAVHHFVLRPPDRAAAQRALDRAGVAWAVYYPRPLDAQPALGGGPSRCSRARAFCAEALAIPCHEEMDEAAVDRVVRALAEVA